MDNKDIYSNLSGEFSKKLNNGGVTLFTGSRGSGKSCTMLAILRYCLEHNCFKEYYLIIPNFQYEQNNSYKWILDIYKIKKKIGVKIYIFDDYYSHISDMIVNRKEIVSTLFLLDDSTSMSLFHISKDTSLKKLIINARHLGPLSIFFVVHTIKNILSGIIKDNINFIGVFDIASEKLLKDIHEIYFSLKMSWNQFLEMYNKHIKRDYGLILLDTSKDKKIDLNMLQWSWLKKSLETNIMQESKR